jgi:hypothetical protein
MFEVKVFTSMTSVVLLSASSMVSATANATLTGQNSALQASSITGTTAVAALGVNKTEFLQSSAKTDVSSTAVLSGGNLFFQGSAVTDVSSTAVLSGGNLFFQSSAKTDVSATANVGGGNLFFQGSAETGVSATALLVGALKSLQASSVTVFSAMANLTGTSDSRGITVCEVIDDILLMWAIPCRESAPDFAIERAMNDLNSAIQTIWNQADDHRYFTVSTLTLEFADAVTVAAIPDNVQNVIGPCRLAANKRPLSPVATLAELELFQSLYLEGGETDEPVAYHIDRRYQHGVEPAKCAIIITPATIGSTSILLDVIKEAPSYSSSDLNDCRIIPIPHLYAESLLMPITRYRASTFFLFADNDHKPGIERDYQMAMASIGMADPNPAKQPEAVEVAAK